MSTVHISSVFDPQSDVVLFEGDCSDLLPMIPDGFVSLIVTSPPYNLGKSYERRIHLNDYLDQQKQVIEQCVRVLSPRGSLCWQVGNYVENSEIIPLDSEIVPEYVKVARERLKLGEEGQLRIRPLERPVYDPDKPGISIPPKIVRFGSTQPSRCPGCTFQVKQGENQNRSPSLVERGILWRTTGLRY